MQTKQLVNFQNISSNESTAFSSNDINFYLKYSVYDNDDDDDDDDDDDVRKKTKQATESLKDPRIVIQPGEPAQGQSQGYQG